MIIWLYFNQNRNQQVKNKFIKFYENHILFIKSPFIWSKINIKKKTQSNYRTQFYLDFTKSSLLFGLLKKIVYINIYIQAYQKKKKRLIKKNIYIYPQRCYLVIKKNDRNPFLVQSTRSRYLLHNHTAHTYIYPHILALPTCFALTKHTHTYKSITCSDNTERNSNQGKNDEEILQHRQRGEIRHGQLRHDLEQSRKQVISSGSNLHVQDMSTQLRVFSSPRGPHSESQAAQTRRRRHGGGEAVAEATQVQCVQCRVLDRASFGGSYEEASRSQDSWD